MRTLLTQFVMCAAFLTGAAGYAQQINLQTQVKGLLPVANGGTGIDTAGLTGCPALTGGVWSVGSCNPIPTDLVTTDTTQTITGAKTFVPAVSSYGGLSAIAASAATPSNNRYSSAISAIAQYWDGTSSQPDIWFWQNFPYAGTNPGSVFSLTHAGSTGPVQVEIPYPVNIRDAFQLISKQAGTPSNNYSSPTFAMIGQMWTGASSLQDVWQWQNVLGTGTAPSSTLTLLKQSGTAGPSTLSIGYPIQHVYAQTLSVTNTITNAVGLQIATVNACAIAAGAIGNMCNVTFVLPVAEPDTNYIVSGCEANTPGAPIAVVSPGVLTTTGFAANLVALSASASSGGVVSCLVTHN